MHMLSRNKIKNPEEQKLGEGGDDKQVIKLMWPNLKKLNLYKTIEEDVMKYVTKVEDARRFASSSHK